MKVDVELLREFEELCAEEAERLAKSPRGLYREHDWAAFRERFRAALFGDGRSEERGV